MENKLVKTAKYGFFSGLGISILFVPYKTTIHTGPTSTVTTYINLQDYVISLLRYSILFTILVLAVVFLTEIISRNKSRG